MKPATTMKLDSKNRAIWRFLLPPAALIAAGLALPLPTLAQTVELATSPMTTSTTTVVKPNMMFVLDDSGSMAWDYMPDTAKDFNGMEYGFHTSQCNGVYYNPDIRYLPPIAANGGGDLNATPTKFSAAYIDGFNTSAGTTDLSFAFSGGSGSGETGMTTANYPAGPAYYFTYQGLQKTSKDKDYFNTSSDFYKECNSDWGVAPGKDVFTKVRLAETPNTNIVVTSTPTTAGTATIEITDVNDDGRFTSVKVEGGSKQIMRGNTSKVNRNEVFLLAELVADQINQCTVGTGGGCQVTGYRAVPIGRFIHIFGPAAAGAAAPTFNLQNGTAVATAFPSARATSVTSIKVNTVEILSATATGSLPIALALDLKNKITKNGYSATVTNNIVTVIGPLSAANQLPALTVSTSGTPMSLTTEKFPDHDADQEQNFANWYSYYSHRMLMMKTGAGLAFDSVTDKYRVGFLSMNNNVSPGIVEAKTFDAAQRTAWYAKVYGAKADNGTPLREALSKVGQYYAHKFGDVTTYEAQIKLGGTGNTSVESVKVNGEELMAASTSPGTTTTLLATKIANQINAKLSTSFAASAALNVITLTGPASASGFTPVVIDDGGGMSFLRTPFSGTTVSNQLNGITPADPVEYSCQQNFTILSTDGYWTGTGAIDSLVPGVDIGNVDGNADRPYSDGATQATTYTQTYGRYKYTQSSTTGSCGSGNKQRRIQQEIGTCTTADADGTCSPTNWQSDPEFPATTDSSTCVGSGTTFSVSFLTDTVRSEPSGGFANSLADVALYYYQTDLRNPDLGNCTGSGGRDVCDDNVFTTSTDNNVRQHMTTFTLGLGARGRMIYSASYLKDASGDYNSVKLGLKADKAKGICTWLKDGTVCNWPTPGDGTPENIDDLWHAAVNARGAFFSATDPTSLADGLRNALTSIKSKVGAAAAAATSTLNPVAGNNQAFVASYVTLQWSGNLEARAINITTGAVNENATWCVENVAAQSCPAPGTIVDETVGSARTFYCKTPISVGCAGGELRGSDCYVPVATACTGTMNAKIASDGKSDTRIIKTAKADGTALIDFDDAYANANTAYFSKALLSNATTGLSQWPAVGSDGDFAAADGTGAWGLNLLRYLRGRWSHELERTSGVPPVPTEEAFYRNRKTVLGDALESQPAYMGPPVFSYSYSGYPEFLTAQASRLGTVYMGTNDGMMHAFASLDGVERWAYVPSMVIPNLWKLADRLYSDQHTNYVNGSPITTDVCTANCTATYNAATPASNPVWKTILVAGLNGGGRGYFALDITNPSSPSLLWEFTPTGSNYIGKVKDADLGYTYGQAVVTRKLDGTWVVLVTSGYDNGTDSATRATTGFVPNSPAGNGGGYLYVLNAGTGAIISKIATGAGTAASPSGLAKIAGYNAESNGNRASYVYGGDLQGNLWRFDINATATAAIGTGSAMKLATLFSETAGTTPQPIMTTPVLGNILGKRVIFIGTGKYLEVPDLSTTAKQTQYAIKDDDATATLVNPRNTLVQQFLINNPNGTATRLAAKTAGATTTGNNNVDFATGRGWFVDLPDSRERVNIDAKLVLGTLLVTSIVPSATECSPGGTGWLNAFDYKTGGAVTTSGIVSGKYDSPIVGTNVLFIEGEPVVEVVTATEPTPKRDPNVDFKGGPPGFTGKRTLWREMIPE
jgi:type IV pilus assembly protein PilY1